MPVEDARQCSGNEHGNAEGEACFRHVDGGNGNAEHLERAVGASGQGQQMEQAGKRRQHRDHGPQHTWEHRDQQPGNDQQEAR